MLGMAGSGVDGDRDIACGLGDGVDSGEPILEYSPPSERVGRPVRDRGGRVARAAAVAAAASSTVPE